MSREPSTHLLPQRLSLVDQTVASLRESISSGRWSAQLPGERELCELLQVSRTTVRSALKQMQQAGWIDVADRRRRTVRTRPRRPRTNPKSRVVALLFPASLQNMHPRTMFVIDAVRVHLSKFGYATESHVQSACFTDRPGRALEKLVRDHPAAVWVVFGSREPMQHWFMRQRLPVLVFGSCQPGIKIQSVDADHYAACHHAAGLLWRKGHRRIAFVTPRRAYGGELDSEQGLRDALQMLPGTSWRALRHDGTQANICALLDSVLRAGQPPSAYLATHAEHALAVTTHLIRRGKRIPGDVAVISRDDHAFLQWSSPAISHYTVDPGQLARRLADAARRLVTTGTLPAHPIRLMPKFVAADTV